MQSATAFESSASDSIQPNTCATWCASYEERWSSKCNWPNGKCAACLPCAEEQVVPGMNIEQFGTETTHSTQNIRMQKGEGTNTRYAIQDIGVGHIVKLIRGVASRDEGQEIIVGTVGRVVQFNSDGDAQIDFIGIGREWILSKDLRFCQLAFDSGDMVRVKAPVMTQDFMQELNVGAIGQVMQVNHLGDAQIEFTELGIEWISATDMSNLELDPVSVQFCEDYIKNQGCAWTKDWSCEGQSDGRRGIAEADGSAGYECCCKRGNWMDVERKFDEPPKFGVILRIFRNEIPYIASFIRHYEKIGVSTFTFLCTVLDDCDEIWRYINERARVSEGLVLNIIPHDDVRWDCLTRVQHNAMRHGCPYGSDQILRNIKADYVLPIDVDEFLALPPGNESLADLVASFPRTALFRFRWIMVPYDGDGDGPKLPYRGYAGASKKYMVRKDALKVIGTHLPELKCGRHLFCETTDLGPFMFHFHYRGLADSLLKDSSEHFKTSGGMNMQQYLDAGEPAMRMKLMAFSAIVAERLGPAVMASSTLMTIDKDAEVAIISAHNISMISARDTYSRFKEALGRQENWNRFAHLVGLAPVLYEPILNQTTLASLEEYSSQPPSSTQTSWLRLP